jgi:hypothetical protein
MGGGNVEEEQLLHETLIDPENDDYIDNPWGEVVATTRGVKQPTRCRDSWAAILFYGQFVGVAVVAGMFGVPAVARAVDTSSSSSSSSSSSGVDYAGLLYGEYSS